MSNKIKQKFSIFDWFYVNFDWIMLIFVLVDIGRSWVKNGHLTIVDVIILVVGVGLCVLSLMIGNMEDEDDDVYPTR